MMTQDTPAEAWENYKNMVQDVCSNEEATLRSLFLDVKSSAARPDEALSTDVGFEEKNDRLKSELRELVKRTYRSCWKNKAD